MIVIKVELWPLGVESKAREIGRAYIANDGAGSTERGDYVAAVCRRGMTAVPAELAALGRTPKATRSAVLDTMRRDDLEFYPRLGEVQNYPRLAYNMWRLVIRALRSCFPEEDRRKAGAR